MDLEILTAMRMVLAVTLTVTVVSSLRLAPLLNSTYRPNLYLVTFWTAANATLMVLLATGFSAVWMLTTVNVSAIMLFGSWSALLIRLTHHLRKAAAR